MKKYLLLLLPLVLILLGFSSNNASAANCAPGDFFNNIDGQPCGNTLIAECAYGDLFSAFTGKPCSSPPEAKPFLTIISPNDNNVWLKGNQQQIVWTSNVSFMASASAYLIINDYSDYMIFGGNGTYKNTGTYNWTNVGTLPIHNNRVAPDGLYWIKICAEGPYYVCDKKPITISSIPDGK